MRMMGTASVEYHRKTVLARRDDHPGQALAYYASRGETPLLWGGAGACALGLVGAVTDLQYERIYGPGGACDPTTGERMVRTTRPGLELVVSAHKSVAELGVIGRAEHMHQIMDAERDATLGYLDELTQRRGGRRGQHAVRTPTEGLIYGTARHATSRAGDPCPHDHVLLANVVRMDDDKGGWKAADTALWRQHLHAATMVGRMASARCAVELGYAIVADTGPSGRLGHWAIAGVPDAVTDAHSKRAAEIEAEMQRSGNTSYQARNVAARTTRAAKRHQSVGDLMPRWVAEIEAVGTSVEAVTRGVDAAAGEHPPPAAALTGHDTRAVVDEILAPDGALAARKVFTRRDVIVAVAPALYGRDPAELDRVVDRCLADPEAVPLIGVTGANERAYATAMTIAREEAIARCVESQLVRMDAPAVTDDDATSAIARAEARLGHLLTVGQRQAVEGIATSGRGVELVVGAAGSGKTTALGAVRDAFMAAGYDVLGTSTSGQAARTLDREAGIDSRTLASLNWRLRHDTLRLTPRHVAVPDEAAMSSDADLVGLLEAASVAGAKVVAVGDPRQLGSVGPGGGFEAVTRRFGAAVHVMGDNVRQRDHTERIALAHLRGGEVATAVSWYADNGRIAVSEDRDSALDATVAGWMVDVAQGASTAMYAWRRANVAELNRRGRQAWEEAGGLCGPELVVGGAAYRAGDRIVTLAPGARGQVVTSETGTVLAVDTARRELAATMDDARIQRFAGEDLDASHLAHGYAVTVHRSQGSTLDRAHVFEDGGGRELAYVKMSRARQRSTVYVVADFADQAVDDLNRSWSQSRRIGWAIDQGTPAPGQSDAEPAATPASAAMRYARLVAEAEAVAAVIPRDVERALGEEENRVQRIEGALRGLNAAQDWAGGREHPSDEPQRPGTKPRASASGP
jgi:conjugative relaxase-like TrwC/TraI family protein